MQIYKAYNKFVPITGGQRLEPTESDIEGPFYYAGAPEITGVFSSPKLPEDRSLTLSGRVLSTDGTPLGGATLDIWQTTTDGVYDTEGYTLRGKLRSDSDGFYKLETIIPGGYEINDDPLDIRCAHLHFKISADGYKLITTQLYFPDDEHNAEDHWYRPGRVIQYPIGHFDFVLEPIDEIASGVFAADHLFNPASPVHIPAPFPAKQGIAKLPDTQLEYSDTGGKGEPVVLLHPERSSTVWGYQQPVFAKSGYRVITYSRRGYGKSDPVSKENPGSAVNDLRNLLKFLGITKCHLVGAAAGGGLAMNYALSYGADLYSVVSSSYCPIGEVKDPDYIKLCIRLCPNGFNEFPAEFRELSPTYRVSNPKGVEMWSALEEKAATGVRIGQVNANAHEVTWEKLAHVKTPVMMIGGDADLYMPPPMLRAYASHIPNCEIAILAEGGHALYWEQPEFFNSIVLGFIAKHR